MENYIEICTAEELEKFIHETVTFHDSMVKEVQMINRGYVMENKSMDMSHQFDARILIQSQWDPIAFELVCIDIKQLNVIGSRDYMGSHGKVIEIPKKIIEISLDNEFIIQCKSLSYRLTPELFGNYEHLGSQVPSDKMIEVTHLDLNWWQCDNCSEAWQIEAIRKYSTCPKCNSVIKLSNT